MSPVGASTIFTPTSAVLGTWMYRNSSDIVASWFLVTMRSLASSLAARSMASLNFLVATVLRMSLFSVIEATRSRWSVVVSTTTEGTFSKKPLELSNCSTRIHVYGIDHYQVSDRSSRVFFFEPSGSFRQVDRHRTSLETLCFLHLYTPILALISARFVLAIILACSSDFSKMSKTCLGLALSSLYLSWNGFRKFTTTSARSSLNWT